MIDTCELRSQAHAAGARRIGKEDPARWSWCVLAATVAASGGCGGWVGPLEAPEVDPPASSVPEGPSGKEPGVEGGEQPGHGPDLDGGQVTESPTPDAGESPGTSSEPATPAGPTLASGIVVEANPKWTPYSIHPAIWADGVDEAVLRITVAQNGRPVVGAPVRVTSLRPALVAASGTVLNDTVTITLDAAVTDSKGVATARVRTGTSTRVEKVPAISFQPFPIRVEWKDGVTWREVDTVHLNAETVASGDQGVGSFGVVPAGLTCLGAPLEIKVRVLQRSDRPLPKSPAAGLYVDIRYLNGGWIGAVPKAGYESWRTDSNGELVFTLTPQAPSHLALEAWADGTPLNLRAGLAVETCP